MYVDIHVCMHVCMNVRMYAHTYVRKYVCIQGVPRVKVTTSGECFLC